MSFTKNNNENNQRKEVFVPAVGNEARNIYTIGTCTLLLRDPICIAVEAKFGWCFFHKWWHVKTKKRSNQPMESCGGHEGGIAAMST